MLAAADTFRAAAIDQLQVWADRAGQSSSGAMEGADPASVVYDAANAAKRKRADVLIVDTAGRLHNKKNLMDELSKINRVLGRELRTAVEKHCWFWMQPPDRTRWYRQRSLKTPRS